MDWSIGRIDKKKLLEDAYVKLLDDFNNTQVHFEGYGVILDPRIPDCSVCNYNCINDFCECADCPRKDKLDIFQHITSDEDPTLKNRLTKEAKKLLKKKCVLIRLITNHLVVYYEISTEKNTSEGVSTALCLYLYSLKHE